MVYLLIALLVAGLVYAVAPLLRAPEPFPENPRPDELKAELEALRADVQRAEGEERKRLLARMVLLERELGALAQEAPRARPVPAWVYVALGVVFLGVGVGLWRYTVPRLPGGTVVSSLDLEQAQELKALAEKARAEDTAQAWLAYADRAWALGDFNRAAEGYYQVIQKDHANLKAYRRFGILLFISGRPEEAAKVLEVVAPNDPDPEGLLFLGNAYYQLGRFEEAIAAWEAYQARGGPRTERVAQLIESARARLEAKTPGEAVYAEKCAACHGPAGRGGVGPALVGNPVMRVPEAVVEIIQKGRGSMPAVPLTEAELQALLEYLAGL